MNYMIFKNTIISGLLIFCVGCFENSDHKPTYLVADKAVADSGIAMKPDTAKNRQLLNMISNPQGLNNFRRLLTVKDSGLTLLNVLHIGDSHLKSGYYSQPFMEKLNAHFSKYGKGSVFFNFQWFCKIGTKYSDYNDLAELDAQLISSKPNLVIISLGTNDAFSGSSSVNFYAKVDHLVQKIKMLSPASSILITTPPDALKLNKQTGTYLALPELQNVVNTIIRYCNDKGIAYWDLHQVMGGNYSINNWILQKLAAPDRVHFTARGYGVFAQWFYEAFTRCIN